MDLRQVFLANEAGRRVMAYWLDQLPERIVDSDVAAMAAKAQLTDFLTDILSTINLDIEKLRENIDE